MEKYTVEINGSQYGPADGNILLQWAQEGRIAPTSILTNSVTGERWQANQHPVLSSFFNTGRASDTPTLSGERLPPPVAPAYGEGSHYANHQPYAANPAPVANSWAVSQAPSPQLGMGYNQGENNSGYGQMAILPFHLRALNWGAFLNPFWWSIFNRTYIGLLVLAIGPIFSFVLLFKGNEWAWQNRRFESEEEFTRIQRSWASNSLT